MKSSGASATGKGVAGVEDDADVRAGFVAEVDELVAGEILMVLDDERHALRGRLRRVVGELGADIRDQLRPFFAPGVAVAAEDRRQREADDRRAEAVRRAQAAVDVPHLQAGADDRAHAEALQPVAKRRKLVVGHLREPRLEDLQRLGAKLGGDLDEALEAAAVRIGARRAVPLQAEGVGQPVGI